MLTGSKNRQGQEGLAACEQGPIREQDVLERRLRCARPVSRDCYSTNALLSRAYVVGSERRRLRNLWASLLLLLLVVCVLNQAPFGLVLL